MSEPVHPDAGAKTRDRNLDMVIESVRDQRVPEDSLQRTLQTASALGMTPTAWKRGWINGALAAIPLGIVIALIGQWLGDESRYARIMTVFWFSVFVCAISFFCLVLQSAWSWGIRGHVFIDAGAHPARKIFWMQSITFAGGGVAVFIAGPTSMPPVFGFFALSMALFFTGLSFGRLQFCERGLLQYWTLLPWTRIESYDFVEGNDPTLRIRISSRIPFLRDGAFPIAHDLRVDIEEFLARQLRPDQ